MGWAWTALNWLARAIDAMLADRAARLGKTLHHGSAPLA